MHSPLGETAPKSADAETDNPESKVCDVDHPVPTAPSDDIRLTAVFNSTDHAIPEHPVVSVQTNDSATPRARYADDEVPSTVHSELQQPVPSEGTDGAPTDSAAPTEAASAPSTVTTHYNQPGSDLLQPMPSPISLPSVPTSPSGKRRRVGLNSTEQGAVGASASFGGREDDVMTILPPPAVPASETFASVFGAAVQDAECPTNECPR